jgi:hypothetical protein
MATRKYKKRRRRRSSQRTQKQNKTKKMNKLICSPTSNKKDYTCYSDKALLRMRELWNARHPDVRITDSTPNKIWTALRENMQNVCNVESCWLRQQFAENKLDAEMVSYTFAPTAPKKWHTNPNEWLTSVDLEKVMKQYEKKYHCFNFIGPSPIDFDEHIMHGECVWKELCEFDLGEELKKGKNKIGIIFNIDPHYKSGSHWISMFIDIKKRFIFFFDSNGDKIPGRIKKLVKRIQKQAKELGFELDFHQNHPKEHQRGDTECGIYSLYLIIQMLTDKKTPEYYMKHRVSDEEMEKLRKKYFNFIE